VIGNFKIKTLIVDGFTQQLLNMVITNQNLDFSNRKIKNNLNRKDKSLKLFIVE